MNLGELRTMVRSVLQCDEELITDFMLDMWIKDGTNRVHAFTDWPWQDTTWTLATAEQYVDFAEITDVDGYVPKEIKFVHSGTDELDYVDPEELHDLIVTNSTTRGEPRYWSARAGRTLMLYPAPVTSQGYVVQGYRAATDWLAGGAGAAPDMPEELHTFLQHWATGMAWQVLQDGQNAQFFLELAQLSMEDAERNMSQGVTGGPIVVGKGSVLSAKRRLTAPSVRIVS